ncbi:MAG: PP-loop family, partial [Actinomycetota bacterium]|nr:PP-loop family [Actinomycetota bacterium]
MGRRSPAPENRASLDGWLSRLPLLAELAEAASAGELARPVIVGCSGGADSLALLALTCAAQIPVVAVYVDHG